ncbi:MAG: DUF3788 domain-containing protein [Bacteroidales bacterium]|nr:DUF3788 domain-containing protein [Bacteroidales bacterium]HQP03180.1 DUF3788 family protein [Bacteroidales bacterium]
MDCSVFTDKIIIPSDTMLRNALKATYPLWRNIEDYIMTKQTGLQTEWAFPGAKYGWSYRIRDKKRVIVYLLPRDSFFMAAFNIGAKAFEAIMGTDVSATIKTELSEAKVYAEGRGIRIPVHDSAIINDILTLVEIKLMF